MTVGGESLTVVTYNVLSPNLCDADHYPECSAKALDPSLRFQKIEDMLRQWMKDGHIICLQEVSRGWADKFVVTCLAHGYTPLFAGYGSPRDGYMGVFTAWDNGKYALKGCDSRRLCEVAELKPPRKGQVPYWQDLWTRVAAYIWTPPPLVEDPVTLTCRRYNRVLITQFETRTGHEFAVINYHMPCQFRNQPFMAHHVKLLMDVAAKVNVPHIVVGDFNISPVTEAYATLCAACPDGEVDGPGFTCWTYSPRNGPFKDQLDYVIPVWFGPSRWLRYVEPTAGPLPTVEHPSDHVPLIKEVAFQ